MQKIRTIILHLIVIITLISTCSPHSVSSPLNSEQEDDIKNLILNKKWQEAKELIGTKYKTKDLFPFFSKIKKSIKNLDMKNFEELVSLADISSPSVRKISPAFLWAQNMTFVFVKVKFSHRIDTPGALEVQNINITFLYDRFIFSALSLDQADFPIHYYLEVETYNHLNVILCSWKLDSVGSVVLEMKKAPSPYFWRNIHYDQFMKWPNQYMWWDVYYNYMDDFNSYGANALLLFDQRELERGQKEEKADFEFNMKKRDKNLQAKRNELIIEFENADYLRKMYCWANYHDKNSHVATFKDWQYWI